MVYWRAIAQVIRASLLALVIAYPMTIEGKGRAGYRFTSPHPFWVDGFDTHSPSSLPPDIALMRPVSAHLDHPGIPAVDWGWIVDVRCFLFILLAIIALVAVLFLFILRAQVRQRTAVLEEEIMHHRQTEQALRLSRLALQQRARGLTLLSELADALHSSLDFEEVTEKAVLLVVNQTEFTAGAIFLAQPERGVMSLVSHVNFPAPLVKAAQELRLDQTIPSPSIEKGEITVIAELEKAEHMTPELRQALLDAGFRMLIAVPLICHQEILGVLSLLGRQSEIVAQDERSTLLAVGRTIALAMANARYVDRIEAEVAVRRQAERALVEERALLARRIVERTSDLRAANLELAQAIKAKDEFLANMSHEFRTPLNAILGISGALEEGAYGPMAPAQRQALRNIIDSAQHLLSLINDILDLSKMGAGKFSLDIGPVEVKALCESSLQMVSQIARNKKVSLHFENDSRVQLIHADGRRMRQVLVNLLGNAVKFTPPGGSVGLEVHGDLEEKVVRFIVWDTGIGINRETMQRLFHPFEQGEQGLMREYDGTGLGLALLHRMVELHGGSIAVESEPGRGSRFTVALAWQESLDPMEDGYILETISPLQIPFRRLLYLCASRHRQEETARSLRAIVTEWGMTLEMYALSDDDNDLQAHLLSPPDLIFVDLEGSDEGEMWHFFQEMIVPHLRDTVPPLIALSSTNASMETLPLSVDGWLVKPPSRSQVLQTFLRILLARAMKEAGERSEHSEPAEPSMKGLKLLVVESGETLLAILQDYFHLRGYIVYSATEGEVALRLAREIVPDAIVISLQLQGMSSLETIRRMRQHEALRTVPIIALTSLSLPDDRERALETGVTTYLLKPVSFRYLEHLIVQLLGGEGKQETREKDHE